MTFLNELLKLQKKWGKRQITDDNDMLASDALDAITSALSAVCESDDKSIAASVDEGRFVIELTVADTQVNDGFSELLDASREATS